MAARVACSRASKSNEPVLCRAQAADPFVDGHQVRAQLLEAAEGGMDGTGAEVAELGDCEQELGAALFQGGQGIGQGASFV